MKKSKVVLVLILVFAFFVGIFVFLSMYKSRQRDLADAQKFKEYSLPHTLSRGDVKDLLDKMRQDPQFRVYFIVLQENEITAVVEDIHDLLVKHADRKALSTLILQRQQKVESLAAVLNASTLPDRYFERPKEYPVLNKTIWQFFFEEFKLIVLGTCYKANYNIDFRFHWKPSSHQAVIKLHRILLGLNNQLIR